MTTRHSIGIQCAYVTGHTILRVRVIDQLVYTLRVKVLRGVSHVIFFLVVVQHEHYVAPDE